VQPIIGVRYQCANCPSSPTSYSLVSLSFMYTCTYSFLTSIQQCSSCEERSYFRHDPLHVFIKIPRPVSKQIESPFALIPKLYCLSWRAESRTNSLYLRYKIPAGPPPGSFNPSDPKGIFTQVPPSTHTNLRYLRYSRIPKECCAQSGTLRPVYG
jgi:hypothetical protein